METVVGEQSGKSSFPWASEGRKEGASVRRCLTKARWGAEAARTQGREGGGLSLAVDRKASVAHRHECSSGNVKTSSAAVRKMTTRWPRGNFPEKISPPHDSLDYTL